MKSRVFILNNEKYIFNFYSFNNYFNKHAKKYNLKISSLETDLADFTNKSSEAIHNWRFKKNGPSDIETIKLICKFFKIKSCKLLLQKKDNTINDEINKQQLLSAKRIYNKVIEFLQDFYTSYGFNDYWYDLDVPNITKENVLYELVNYKLNKIILTLRQEYIFLKDTPIYDSIEEFIYNDLYNIFDGKLSYAYRFENSDVTSVEDDYYKALNKINDIIRTI